MDASGFQSIIDDDGFLDPEDDGSEEIHASTDPDELGDDLLVAARNGNLVQVRHLLSMRQNVRFDINCKGRSKANRGWTALHLAAYFGHTDVASVLIEHGADTNVQNDTGDTPLHRAAYTGREDMVTLLIKHGSDVGIINGESLLAKQTARSESTRRLVEAAESYENRKIEQQFLRAAREGDMTTLTRLLNQRKPSNISCTDRHGNSALHCAAYCGRKEAAVLLIQHGIDTSLRNAKGQLAEELACDSQMKKLLSVPPLKPSQKEVSRFEGPLLRRSSVWGWKPVWCVLEKGVLSIFRNRADASTGVKRRGFKYLDQAKLEVPRENINMMMLRLNDSSKVTFSVEMDTSVHINRQAARMKWINALQDHIEFCKRWSQQGATVSDDEENDEQEVMPLGSIQDVLQDAQVHQQLMERHATTVSNHIDDVISNPAHREHPEVVLATLHTELQHLRESSRGMMDAMNHAVTILAQQDKVRNIQLQQESEKSRVLQDALRVLAEEHHQLERSIRTQSPLGTIAMDRPGMADSDDDDEFHDCFESSFSHSTNSPVANGNSTVPGCSAWGGRTQLPAAMFSRNDFSVWSILKQCIGKELSKITMPVIFNEPLSFVQRVVEYMEYADLLRKASECDDPIKRLEYVAAFAVSATASNWERIGKPFNPLLGETYELNREDLGFKVVCEQVSHHPPVSAFHVIAPEFTIHGAIHPKLKFWGKSIEVTPKGMLTLKLHRHNEVFTWQNVNCCVHNIIVGKIWVEHYGSMEITNLTTKHKVSLHFKPSSWFSKELHKVEGFLFDQNKKKVKAFYGKWIDTLYSYDIDVWERTSTKHHKTISEAPSGEMAHATPPTQDGTDDPPPAIVKGSSCDLQLPGQHMLWQATPKPANTHKYYSFTEFAMMLNELREDERANLPPTDSRLRPDIRKMEEGDMDGASSQKARMEEKQRASRKERKKRKQEWKPRWFELGTNPDTGKEDWLYTGEYWNRSWERSPDIF